MKPKLEIILANPRGFCAGVERAVSIVKNAIEVYGKPVYVRHEIVHNRYVVDELAAKGAIFVREIDEIPEGAVVIFSAHGVSEKVEESSKLRGLNIINATCPLVTKVHLEAKRQEQKNKQIILIGHAGHPEVEGTSGRVSNPVLLVQTIEDAKTIEVKDPTKLAYVTQTTLSVDDTKKIIHILKNRFPEIDGPDIKDICYATQNRQDAVSKLCKQVDLLLVIGANNSSNSNRLRDLGEEQNIASYLINNEQDINFSWFAGKNKIGITAGASAPEILVNNVISFLENHFIVSVQELEGKKENIHFKLPKEVTL